MKRTHKLAGFSIVEIVIAVLIMGILASILIPVLITKMEKSKIVAAQTEIQELVNAEERVSVDLGYYVRFYALDDLPTGDGIGLGVASDRVDGIQDESQNNLYTDPTKMFIRIKTDPAPTAATAFFMDYTNFWRTIAFSNSESPYRWDGPYCQFKRTATLDEHNLTKASAPNLRHLHDTPIDPWGNDYLFLNRVGMVDEPGGTFSTDGITQGFDRPTILSLGPNGIAGDATDGNYGKGDDIYRSFGY